jgi:hypothetical protein
MGINQQRPEMRSPQHGVFLIQNPKASWQSELKLIDGSIEIGE